VVSWITPEQVEQALGVAPATPTDADYLTLATAAAQQWAFDRRRAFGYDDAADVVPNDRVALGAILYAVSLYRERGSLDSFTSFGELATPAPVGGTMGQVNRLLGLNRPVVA
jgi:hypothetical protein